MEQKRFFGTYNGEFVEYRIPKNVSKFYVILENGKSVVARFVTPSPYPWQFHTREFWDAHPGMRYIGYNAPCCWVWSNEPLAIKDDGFYTNSPSPTEYGGILGIDFLWQGDPAASLFENPFFRHYPAELDDPKTWEQWPTAICGAWDKSGRFYCYSVIPKLGAGHDGSCWIGIMIDEDESAFNGTFTGDWRESLIVRPAALPDVLLSPALYGQIMGRGKRPLALLPMVKHPKAAPKRVEKPLSVRYVNSQGMVFVAKTEAARAWLNEQAPMFGDFDRWIPNNGDRCSLFTDFPHAAMRYLIDGFYNRNKPTINMEEVEKAMAKAVEEYGEKSKPRTEKRTIEKAHQTMSGFVLIKLSGEYNKITRATAFDLMQRFDVLLLTDLIGKEITVRIDADKLVIVEGRE